MSEEKKITLSIVDGQLEIDSNGLSGAEMNGVLMSVYFMGRPGVIVSWEPDSGDAQFTAQHVNVDSLAEALPYLEAVCADLREVDTAKN